MQSSPQLIPAGLLVTVPSERALPSLTTVNERVGVGCCENVAVTLLFASMVTLHVVPLTVLQPDQLAKLQPCAGVAVSVTAVPCWNGAEHVAPQLIPAGLLVTVPEPLLFTVSVRFTRSNVAVTVSRTTIPQSNACASCVRPLPS